MKYFLIVLFLIGQLSCVPPSIHFNQEAEKLGFKSQIVSTSKFQHRIFLARPTNSTKTLHVYLDGDGTPWEKNRWISTDPTARNPLILRLMVLDQKPAILLGRPCYYGLADTVNCDDKFWTSHRYSEEVVRSMAEALNNWLANKQVDRLVLIGYSGGGGLAILLADKVKGITQVVTVAGNLNIKRWVKYHGYLPLIGSLNPAELINMRPEIQQFHIVGKKDLVVPGFMIKDFVDQQQNADYYVFSKQDHACCWEEVWQDILQLIEN